MFISSPLAGQIYYAQRSCKSVRLLWSVLKIADPFCNGRRIHAREVPVWVKARAYDMLERDRLREKGCEGVLGTALNHQQRRQPR
jgi:hypothetical protein